MSSATGLMAFRVKWGHVRNTGRDHSYLLLCDEMLPTFEYQIWGKRPLFFIIVFGYYTNHNNELASVLEITPLKYPLTVFSPEVPCVAS